MNNLKFTILLIILFFIYKFCFNKKESFSNHVCSRYFQDYNNYIFPISKVISKNENNFIKKWINKLDIKDFTNSKYLNTYMIGYTFSKDGKYINKSKFSIGTLTKNKEFKRDCLELLKKYSVELKEPNGYIWYSMAWNIDNEILKIYMINKKKILCYQYSILRNKNDIKGIYFKNTNLYKINKNYKALYKSNKVVFQINSEVLPINLKKKYTKFNEFDNIMNGNNWILKSYSEYEDKLHVYYTLVPKGYFNYEE